MLAGINAALLPEKEFVLKRENSYIGVMVDDLTSQGGLFVFALFCMCSFLSAYVLIFLHTCDVLVLFCIKD